MSRSLAVRNRHRRYAVDLRLLRGILSTLLDHLFPHSRLEVSVQLVNDAKMIRLNETYVHHRGTTDVITFDYRETGERGERYADVFVCLDEARRQARRFGVTWQSELVRYLVHGALHLHGYDDRRPAARRRMKSVENRLLRTLARHFPLRKLAKRAPRGIR